MRILVLCAFLLTFTHGAPEPGGLPVPSQRMFRVGALVSLTGPWSSLGRNTAAALQIAADRIEARAHFRQGGYRVQLLIRDTGLDPARALAAIEDLHRRGAVAVIGPQSSAELAAIKPYADRHGILVVSQSSTASSLAIAGDNVFRFCPNDKREAEAITALMWRDGIRTIVPLWRNDAGNNGLHDSVTQAFLALGGHVGAGARYEPTTTDFAEATGVVASEVTDVATAVYLAAFDEVVDVFHAAQSNAALSIAPWYGSDGVALSQALPGDPAAAAFASSAGYPNPIFGLNDALQSRWQPVSDAVQARTGITPDAFALSAYDSLFVVHRALEAARGARNIVMLRHAFVDAADRYTGVTGSTALDSNGDRLNADFDFWAVRLENGAYTWIRVGRYSNGTLY